MFKLSFDLPKPKKENGKLKNRKERKIESKVGADDLQAMFRELGRADPAAATPKSAEPEISPSLEKKSGSAKPDKRPREEDSAASKKQKTAPSKNEKTKSNKNEFTEVKSKRPKPEQKPDQKPQEKAEQKFEQKHSDTKPSKTSKPAGTTKPSPSNAPKKETKLTPMQLKMQQKLSGGRFRWINEQLYTVSSDQALKLFKKSPDMFNEYHTGFRHQVESWPENPIDNMVKTFKERLQKPLSAPGGLPADRDGQVVVADMGCGEAQLALQVSKLKGSSKSRKANFKIHSFDLYKANDRITVADIAHTPLEDNSVHVVVFCLALMGTNTEDFIKEALRIVKPFGEIWIAEIKSRFDIVKNKTDTQRFVDRLRSHGLHHKSTDESNKMFVAFQFVNIPRRGPDHGKPKFIDEQEAEDDDSPLLKPCIYKKR